LDDKERERAARYRFSESRTRFVVARATLRYLISKYADIAPNSVIFEENDWGKPTVALPDTLNLEFNVAHSHELVLLAFCCGKPVGIDIEFERVLADMESIVNHYFSELERKTFADLPDDVKLKAFYRGWTCKEAYIKARGKGLSIPLNAFDVALNPVEPATLLVDRTNPGAHLEWALMDIKPAENYTAALAFHAGNSQYDVVQYWIDCPRVLRDVGFP
jgi:4'-phosphopantetheinyl transferase